MKNTGKLVGCPVVSRPRETFPYQKWLCHLPPNSLFIGSPLCAPSCHQQILRVQWWLRLREQICVPGLHNPTPAFLHPGTDPFGLHHLHPHEGSTWAGSYVFQHQMYVQCLYSSGRGRPVCHMVRSVTTAWLPAFELQPYHLLALWPWPRDFKPLGLSFLIYKMESRGVPAFLHT